ncbi:MAG: STAS domain-containing protein [Isosphaeraceae bacterium]
MPMNVREEGSLIVLSNFGRLMNDPRYVDAARDVGALLDEGHRRFVIDLDSLRDLSDVALGLLTTITRRIRQREAEAVLIHVHRDVLRHLDEMRMDDYWEIFDDYKEIEAFFKEDDPEPEPND